jgi:flagellar hook-basal body protein
MSFYTSLTGLNAATAQLGVTSNNIANVGTIGFKRSRADFGDIFATSPLQKSSSTVGQGVALKQVTQEFNQGNISFSSNSLDLAITGDGFFPMRSADGLQEIYTRNGSFMLNEQFNVVNTAGQRLMAATVDSTGSANVNERVVLTIPQQTTGEAKQTTQINLGLNFPSDAAVITETFNRNNPATYSKSTAMTVYDAGGNGYLATIYYVKTQNASQSSPTNKWQTYVFVGDDQVNAALQQATDANGENLYVDKYGRLAPYSEVKDEITTDKTILISLDELTDTRTSQPATILGTKEATKTLAGISGNFSSGLDFGAITSTTLYNSLEKAFKISVDGSDPFTVDLRYLVDHDRTLNGAEMATELTNLLQREFGGRSQFVDSGGATDFDLTVTKADGTTETYNIDVAGMFANGATPSIEDLIAEIQDQVSVTHESNTITFSALTSGQTITINGLTFTAGSSGATAAQVASAFSNLSATTIYSALSAITNDTNGGTFTAGTWTAGASGWTTPTYTSGNTTVVATYGSDSANTTNITVSATGGATAPTVAESLNPNEPPPLIVKYDYGTQRLSIKLDPTGYGYSKNTVLSVQSELGNILNIPTVDTTLNSLGEIDGYNLIPNGAPFRDLEEQRYGMQVIYDSVNGSFKFQSGTTGDASSLAIELTKVSGSDDPNIVAMFGLRSEDISTSEIATRGITSQPAVAYGSNAGVFSNNSFAVNETNNRFIVTVDGIKGTVILPVNSNTTLDTFIENLEKGINSLTASNGDNLDGEIPGSTPATVNGVKVSYDAAQGRLKFTTGTTGTDSYIKISGDAYWGLDNVEAGRGSVSTWISPSQHADIVGGTEVDKYIDSAGNETVNSEGYTPGYLPPWSPVFLQKGQLTFDTSGKLVSPIKGTQLETVYLAGGKGALTININYAGSTQYQSSFAVLSQSQDGAPEGDLVGVTIGNDGLVSASFSNGTQKSLAKILLTNFSSPSGLRQIGDSSFLASAASGRPQLGNAGSAGFGTLRAGATERSNVDLTNELVDLITSQRNFQANAKAIETSSTMTSAIINIRS